MKTPFCFFIKRLQLYREGKLYSRSKWFTFEHFIHCPHTMLSMHHCIRVVPVTEEVKVEATAEEVTPEVVQGFDICGTEPDPTLFSIQGKPRCISPSLCFIKFIT